jgi:hypothetical protein
MRAVDLTKRYLKECIIYHRLDENKNTHLEHLEDLIFNDGLPGGKAAIQHLVGFYEMLKGNAKTSFNLTTKWDGAPAIFAGIDPADGKFFVGTKGVFNKNPKLNKSLADIKANHPDKVVKGENKSSEGLRKKLATAFTNLRKLNFTGVVQGDLLWCAKEDIQTANIKGEEYIVFKPNTIIYAVPKNSDLAKEILSSNIGIVFHTEYVGGPTLADMNAKFGYDASALGDGSNAGVWYRDAIIKDYSGQVTMTADESAMLKSAIEDANKNLSNMGNLEFLKNNEFGQDLRERIKTSVNKIIKDQGQFEKDPAAFATAFITDYKTVMKKAIEGLKLDKNKVTKTQLMLDGIKFLEDNTQEIVSAYVVYLDLIRAKEMIVKKLANVKQIDTFVQNAEGDYEVTGEEGFVAVDHIGNAIKLVDRLDFSLKNFGSGKPGA